MALGGIQAGKAFVEFILSDKKFKSQLHTFTGALRKAGNVGLAFSTPILAGFGAAAAAFASVGSELNDMSARTGISVESLSELKFAAQQTGTSLEAIQKAAKELQQHGVDPKRFDEIANSIAAIPDPTKQAQAAMKAFGARSGQALLPLLRDLPALREQARALGLTMSTEQAAAADALGDSFDTVKAQLVAMTVQMGAAIAGPLTEFLTWAQGTLTSVIGFIQANPDLVAAIAAVTVGIAAASAAMIVLGTIMAVISAHPIIATLTLIAGLVLGLATYFGLASNAASGFKASLDAQSRQVQTQLSATVRSTAVAPAGAAAAGSLPTVRNVSAEIAQWTHETAVNTAGILRKMAGGGLVMGAG